MALFPCSRSSSLLTSVLIIYLVSGLIAGAEAVRKLQQQQPTYCVAKPNANATALQAALDWACGSARGVNCDAIRQGGSCFQPNTIANHASYAFTSYYYAQSEASHACDFNGLAALTNTNPSSGTCVYPSSPISAPSTNSSISSVPVGTTSPSTTTSGPSAPGANLLRLTPTPSPNAASPHHMILRICNSGTFIILLFIVFAH